MTTTRRQSSRTVLFVLWIMVLARPAGALEISGGVSIGVIQAGTVPHLAVGPRALLSWRGKSGLLFSVHDLCGILPPIPQQESGIYNQTSIAIGYAWKGADFSIGPSIAAYSMLACGLTLCGRVNGMALGGHVQINLYVAGPLGLSVNAEFDWIGGNSLVLPSGVASMLVAGPVIRWSER
jgi:hypothetical protein